MNFSNFIEEFRQQVEELGHTCDILTTEPEKYELKLHRDGDDSGEFSQYVSFECLSTTPCSVLINTSPEACYAGIPVIANSFKMDLEFIASHLEGLVTLLINYSSLQFTVHGITEN